MKVWFNTQKYVGVIFHVNRIDEKYYRTAQEMQKRYYKSQYPFIIESS